LIATVSLSASQFLSLLLFGPRRRAVFNPRSPRVKTPAQYVLWSFVLALGAFFLFFPLNAAGFSRSWEDPFRRFSLVVGAILLVCFLLGFSVDRDSSYDNIFRPRSQIRRRAVLFSSICTFGFGFAFFT
jgi:hypothetical protein